MTKESQNFLCLRCCERDGKERKYGRILVGSSSMFGLKEGEEEGNKEMTKLSLMKRIFLFIESMFLQY